MPTCNVNLTEELEGFITAKVESGRYKDASDVVRAALRNLEREDLEYQAKFTALRAAIDDGDSSGIASGNSFERVRASINRPQR